MQKRERSYYVSVPEFSFEKVNNQMHTKYQVKIRLLDQTVEVRKTISEFYELHLSLKYYNNTHMKVEFPKFPRRLKAINLLKGQWNQLEEEAELRRGVLQSWFENIPHTPAAQNTKILQRWLGMNDDTFSLFCRVISD